MRYPTYVLLFALAGLNILTIGIIIGRSGDALANSAGDAFSFAAGAFIPTTKDPDADSRSVPEGIHTAWIRKNGNTYFCTSPNNKGRTLKCESVLVDF